MAKPQPSDWGKLSQGQSYIPWALDIARAVSALGLGENVGMLFWYVIERSWKPARFRKRNEWSDPAPVSIVYQELAEKWGTQKQRVYEAKKWLVAARMLLDESEGLYVNKNAHEWVNPKTGAALLNAKQLAYAVGARSRGEGQSGNGATLPDGNGTTLPEPPSGNGATLPGRQGGNGLPLPGREGGNGTTLPAIEERARESLKTSEKEKPSSGRAGGKLSSEQQKTFDDLEAFAIKALTQDRYDAEFLAQPLAGWVRMGYSTAKIRNAMQRASVNAPPNKTAQYVNGCLIKGVNEPEPKPREPPPQPVYHVAPADSVYRKPPQPRDTDERRSR